LERTGTISPVWWFYYCELRVGLEAAARAQLPLGNLITEQEIMMKWIRKVACCGVFILGSFTLLCLPAFGQNARGVFTLNRDVRWQNEVVPAGEYKFSVELHGSSEMLTLRGADADSAVFMILVNDADNLAPAAAPVPANGKLTLTSQSGNRYVSTMDVPSIGKTLHFSVPAETIPRAISEGTSAAAK
jgi:hypothetical protein